MDAARGASVAVYWDFENLHAALCEAKDPGMYARPDNRFKPQEPLVDIQAVVDVASSFGSIAIHRAYCNWQFFGRYRDQLLQNAIELVQLFPPGGAAKNGADIKLCLDAFEDLGRFPHIDTIVVVGGDSDFMPLSQKIKAAGRLLVGVGTRRSTNKHWARSCHEFRYYESLVAPPVLGTGGASQPVELELAPVETPVPTETSEVRKPTTESEDLLRRAVSLLAEKHGEPWVNKGETWHMMKRLDSTYDLKREGHESLTALIKALDSVVEVRKGEFDQQLRLR